MKVTVMDKGRLEALLLDLGSDVAFPATPDLAEAVTARLPSRPPARAPRRLLRIATVAVALVVALVVALPGPRRAVADLLGIGGVSIAILPELPAVPAASEFTGEPASLEEAQSAVKFELLVPEAAGPPDLVFLDQSIAGGLVTLAYSSGDGTYGLVITQMSGQTDMGLLEKAVGPEGSVTVVSVGGDSGFWVEGDHVLFVLDPSGEIREDRARLVGNTLLFVRDGVTARIESGLDLARALAVAESLVPYPG